MDLKLKGKVAVVTGGSLGIGRAITEALAAEGVRVAIVARSKDALQQAADAIGVASGVEILAAPADVSSTEQVEAMMEMVAKRFGRIDILVNGAAHPGGLVRSEIENADPEGLLQDINIKVVGYMRCAKAAASHMKRNQWGRIINIGGLTGRGSKQLSGMRNVAVCH
ncbi:MAG: SDR family oxidoreductase, partial [Rhodoferax sp.]|nr:SDR family oxidoreductase [Rhodoferax sp.]